jgi:hypothetical protein|tara:strand:- start:1394 stop:1672 length:279 start_codon:yes stop_codon:yes gene_type:complete
MNNEITQLTRQIVSIKDRIAKARKHLERVSLLDTVECTYDTGLYSEYENNQHSTIRINAPVSSVLIAIDAQITKLKGELFMSKKALIDWADE